MTHHEIVKKLIGPINPLGCSARDPERFENLKQMCVLVESLLMDIDDMRFNNRGSHEFSVKQAHDYAEAFLSKTLEPYLLTHQNKIEEVLWNR